jgi:hypothetical protein
MSRRKNVAGGAAAPDNVIRPAAFAGKPVVVNPKRKGGHATRMKGVIGLRYRRDQRKAEAKWKAEAPKRAAREAMEKARLTPEELRNLHRTTFEVCRALQPLLELLRTMNFD